MSAHTPTCTLKETFLIDLGRQFAKVSLVIHSHNYIDVKFIKMARLDLKMAITFLKISS